MGVAGALPPPPTPPAIVEKVRSDVARIDHRLDELEQVHQQRTGELEAAEIRLEGRFTQLRNDVGVVSTQLNSLRLYVEKRFNRTDRMLELLLRERGLEVPA